MNAKKLLIFILLVNILSVYSAPLCNVCHFIVQLVQKTVPRKPIIPLVQMIAYKYCVKKHIQDKNVCKGAVKQMTQYIITSFWKHSTNPHVVCQNVKFCKNQYVKRNLNDDIERILANKPEKEWQRPTSRKILKIMHISDLHPDLFYAPGSPVVCTEPVCCRANVTAKANNTKKAGYWGSLGQCDVPIQTFDIFLKQMKKYNLDAIIWTGDNTPHDIWQQSQSYNLNFTIMLSEKIRQATNITVIPSMGNHQSYPVNVYDFKSKQRQSVLNRGLAQTWSFWLDQNAKKMQSQKGYFRMIYPHLNNLKILSINTQAGNNQNWILLQDPSDPGNQLQWMEKQLLQSESKGQIVYIIGHIPPKSNLNDWAMRFNALVDRFSYIIRGQFYGHTHSDQFSFQPKMKNLSNINIKTASLSNYYLVAPAMTTSTSKVPEYRIMDIDFDTLQVLDYSQYRLDLRKYQTEDQKPQFQLFYKFKQTWKINDMTISGGINELRNKLRDSAEMQKLYQYNKCGGICQGTSGIGVFCSTAPSHQYQSQCMEKPFTKSIFQKVAGSWIQIKHKKQIE